MWGKRFFADVTKLRLLRWEMNLNCLNGPTSKLKCPSKGGAETHTEEKALCLQRQSLEPCGHLSGTAGSLSKLEKARTQSPLGPLEENDFSSLTLIHTLWPTRLWESKFLLFEVAKFGASLVVQRLWFHLAIQGVQIPSFVSNLRLHTLSGQNNNIKNRSDIITHSVLHTKSLQACLTLCDPMDCILPGSFVHGILQARIPEWVAMPFSRASSWPGIEPTPLTSPALGSGCCNCHLGSPTNSIKT